MLFRSKEMSSIVQTVVDISAIKLPELNPVDACRGFPTELTPRGWPWCIIRILEECRPVTLDCGLARQTVNELIILQQGGAEQPFFPFDQFIRLQTSSLDQFIRLQTSSLDCRLAHYGVDQFIRLQTSSFYCLHGSVDQLHQEEVYNVDIKCILPSYVYCIVRGPHACK